MKSTAAYGHWGSPISAGMLASKSTRLGQMQLMNGDLYWLESRPEEKGRGVIVKYINGQAKDITPEKYSVRTRVHEYGSGDFWAKRFGNSDSLIFCNDSDQRLYQQNLITHEIIALTEKSPFKHTWRYADGDISANGQMSVCVREQHTESGSGHEVINDLVLLDLQTQTLRVIAQGADFYSNPRISPDGTKISWLSWDHPNMPWDQSQLWLAEIDPLAQVSNPQLIAGGQSASGQSVSVYNPQWSQDNKLYYADDRNGWWHLYCADNSSSAINIFAEIEFGFAQWVFGCNSFQVLKDSIIAIGTRQGLQALYQISLETGEISLFNDQWSAFNGEFIANEYDAFFMAANPAQGETIIQLSLDSQNFSRLKNSKPALSENNISVGQAISFATSGNDSISHAYFYSPTNNELKPTNSERPPLIVMSHGGPTAMTDNGFKLAIQFWTTRGFAVADVNYRGSSGYGRAYRTSLNGQWGIYDVDDCIAAAEYLAEQGLVDGNRLAIRGGSAGGFTTLCALTFHDKFKVGMSRYGVADLESLAQDSHKFEIRYLDSMVGKLPEELATYKARSPSEHTDKLSCPILLLQGLDDKVVPPSQSEAMVKALKDKGLPYECIEFAGEGHGFRKPETIIRAFEAELAFYREYLL